MTITKESMILIFICMADLVSTITLISPHHAIEGKILMAYYVRHGVGTLIMVKLLLMCLPIFVAEWSRQYRPRFVKLMLRAAIGIYVGSYILVFLTVNVAPAVAQAVTHSQSLVQQARR